MSKAQLPDGYDFVAGENGSTIMGHKDNEIRRAKKEILAGRRERERAADIEIVQNVLDRLETKPLDPAAKPLLRAISNATKHIMIVAELKKTCKPAERPRFARRFCEAVATRDALISLCIEAYGKKET